MANCSLILSLQQSFNYKQVEELGLLDVRLVIRIFSQLELLFVGIILGLGTGEPV